MGSRKPPELMGVVVTRCNATRSVSPPELAALLAQTDQLKADFRFGLGGQFFGPQPGVRPKQGERAVYQIEVEFHAVVSVPVTEQPPAAWEFDVTYELTYALPAGRPGWPIEAIREFAEQRCGADAWPHVREFVSSLASRMGIPGLNFPTLAGVLAS